MFDTLNEGFDWIESYTNLEKKTNQVKRYYRLDRMFSLLEAFGNPQNSFRSIHLAGSKGKGSTAVLMAAGLQNAGYKTGLYTSPHLLCYQERIRINEEMLDDQIYLNQINRIFQRLSERTISLQGGDEPTTFELLTLLGFLIFESQECSWAVIETGLGGRLDATNTIIPALSVITPIEIEHSQWLGDTLEKIAAEKAGIIKDEVPVLSSGQKKEVKEILIGKCREKRTEVEFVSDDLRITEVCIEISGTKGLVQWDKGQKNRIQLNMIGKVQLENAAIALRALRKVFPDADPHNWIEGFKIASLPGRMQVLSSDPLVIADGAHTPNSLTLAIQAFRDLSKGSSEAILIFACGDDKNAKEMAACAAEGFAHIIITKPGFFKKSNPRNVFEIFQKYHSHVLFEETPEEALSTVRKKFPASPLLIAGSFFLAGELIRVYELERAQSTIENIMKG